MAVSIPVGNKLARRQRLCTALLLLAFLPTLTFLGHWDEIFGPADAAPAPASALFDLTADQAEQIEHSQHCHTDLASCSAQPMPAGVGLFATREALLGPLPSLVPAGQPAYLMALSGPPLAPSVPPPRPAPLG